jgi:hypothetical protein
VNPLASLFQSRKTNRAVLGSVIVLITLWSTWATFNTPEARAAALIGAIVSVAGLFGIDIRGIATEDAALKSAPQQQVNVGSEVSNPPAAPAPPIIPPIDRPKGT